MEGVFRVMNITARILDACPNIKVYSEGKWGEQTINTTGYHSFNDAGVECEVGEFLYAMVRLLKPQLVLETGTHFGVGSLYMGMALRDNNDGDLDTYEFIPEIREQALINLRDADLLADSGGPVSSYLGNVNDLVLRDQYQLMFLDTEPQTRFDELIRFWNNLDEGGYVFIHDLHRHMHQIPNEEHGFAWPFGPIPEALQRLVADGRARPIHFPNPRGMTGFYKVSQEDYEWQK